MRGAAGPVESKSSGDSADIEEPRESVDGCAADELSGGDDEFVFTSAFPVVDGSPGPACLGVDDPIVLAAWEILETITPPQLLGGLALFGGFEPDGDEAADTLAFVTALDANGDAFQMSINTDRIRGGRRGARALTMAHQFSHVFTSTPDQLDRTYEGIDSCDTHFNGEGCYLPDSLMVAWNAGVLGSGRAPVP